MQPTQLSNVLGLVYAMAVMVLTFLLLRSDRMNRTIVLGILVLTSVIGFLLVAPLIPVQMQSILLGKTPAGMPLPVLLALITILIASSLIVGRIFCGYACPIGTVQELAYWFPSRKLVMKNRKIAFIVQTIAVLAFFLGGALSLSVLGALGVKEFFQLDLANLTFLIFAVLILASIFLYRPFCRFLCPFGYFSGLMAGRSMFKMVRSEGCNNCGSCSKKCPTGQVKGSNEEGDCFLCLRCVDVCRKDAMKYSIMKSKKGD